MTEWTEYRLGDICTFGKEKTEVTSLTNETYISTENMLPNRGGITKATTLPTGDYTPSFEEDDTLVSNIRPYFKKIWKATFAGGCSADVLVFKANKNVSKLQGQGDDVIYQGTSPCQLTKKEERINAMRSLS